MEACDWLSGTKCRNRDARLGFVLVILGGSQKRPKTFGYPPKKQNFGCLRTSLKNFDFWMLLRGPIFSFGAFGAREGSQNAWFLVKNVKNFVFEWFHHKKNWFLSKFRICRAQIRNGRFLIRIGPRWHHKGIVAFKNPGRPNFFPEKKRQKNFCKLPK